MSIITTNFIMPDNSSNFFAPGIPDKQKMERIKPASKEEVWDVNVQRHDAEQAGTHWDLRLSPPGSNKAYSWAVRKGMPEPGDKHLAVRQPDHHTDYMGFEGEIESGYGKGKVKSEIEDKAEVLKSVPEDKIYFNIYQGRDTGRYLLMKWQDKDWMLYNYTPTEDTKEYKDVPTYKGSYKSLETNKLDPDDEREVWAPKLDGAHNTIVLRGDKRPDVFSYRSSRRGDKKIDHTFRTNLYKKRAPKDLDKTILRAELYLPGEKGSETARILNSNVWKARKLQEENRPLDVRIFDLVKFKGQNVENKPFKEKLPMLREVSQKMKDLRLPPMAETSERKKELFSTVMSGDHPLSTEGLIVYRKDENTPRKAKIMKDWDVKITGTYPANPGTKYEGSHIGGFEGIVENPAGIPNKKIKIGTGLDDEMRRDAYENPEKYIGEWAKIKSQHIHSSGKHQAPVLLEFRSEKYPNVDLQEQTHQYGGNGFVGEFMNKVEDEISDFGQDVKNWTDKFGNKKDMTKKAQIAVNNLMEKDALLGIGYNVGDLDDKGDYHASVGFPYGVGVHRNLPLDKKYPEERRWIPGVGIGLTGPILGLNYRSKARNKQMEKKAITRNFIQKALNNRLKDAKQLRKTKSSGEAHKLMKKTDEQLKRIGKGNRKRMPYFTTKKNIEQQINSASGLPKHVGFKLASQLEKTAGSELYLIPGKEPKKIPDNHYSPSTKYHYTAQGKYSAPGVGIIGESKTMDLSKNIAKDSDPAYYVPPEKADKYIKAYKHDTKARLKTISSDAVKNKDRSLWDKLTGDDKKKLVLNKKEYKKKVNDPEFKKEHKKTLQWMKEHKDKGFTIRVG